MDYVKLNLKFTEDPIYDAKMFKFSDGKKEKKMDEEEMIRRAIEMSEEEERNRRLSEQASAPQNQAPQ